MNVNKMTGKLKTEIIRLIENWTHYELIDADDYTGNGIGFIQNELTIEINSVKDFGDFELERDMLTCLEGNDYNEEILEDFREDLGIYIDIIRGNYE